MHYSTTMSTQTKGKVLLHLPQLPQLPHLPHLPLLPLLLHLPQIPLLLLLLHRHWRMAQQRRPSLSRLLMQQSRPLLGWLQTSSTTTTWVHLSALPLLRCDKGSQLTMLPDLPLLELQGSR